MLLKAVKRMCSTSSAPLRSSLCIVGPKASEVVRKIIPDIDIEKVIADGPEVHKQNLLARKIHANDLVGMSVEEVFAKLLKFQKSTEEMLEIIVQREAAQKEYKEVPYEVTFDKLKDIKNIYKQKQREIWTNEENAIVPYLKLPNILDPQAPDQDLEIYQSRDFDKNQNKVNEDDFEVKYESIFLSGDLAVQELNMTRQVLNFLSYNNYEIIAPPDIVKNHILEGFSPTAFQDPKDHFNLEKSSDFGHVSSGLGAHLVGSASTPALLSYFVKNILQNSSLLPLKYFSIGRQYLPLHDSKPSLNNSEQTTACGFLILNKDLEQANDSHEALIEDLKVFYDSLQVNYKIVMVSKDKLNLAESCRIEVKMWSDNAGEYVSVGSVSKYGNFLSKRLSLIYSENGTLQDFYIISGTFIDVFKVLDCKYKIKK